MNPTTIKKNTKEYKNLEAVASILTAVSPNGIEYMVEDVYFDYGQDWLWTTISYEGEWGGVQVLNPVEWEKIILAGTIAELSAVADMIRGGKYFGDK